MEKFEIRPVRSTDAAAILDIYTPFITSTSITFETAVPTPDEFRARIEGIRRDFPYVVAQLDGNVVAYAYAHTYRERSAYRFNAELSVYVSPTAQGHGIAKRLYSIIERDLTRRNYSQAIAIITIPNEKSVGFHVSAGYKLAFITHNIGWKAGAWHDTATYTKELNGFCVPPNEIIPFDENELVFN